MNIDNKSHYFVTPRRHNHSASEPITNNNFFGNIKLGLYPLQFQINNTTNMKHQKLHPYVKDHICFQTHVKTDWATQFSKPRGLSKVDDTIIYVGSFEHKSVVLMVLFHSKQLK